MSMTAAAARAIPRQPVEEGCSYIFHAASPDAHTEGWSYASTPA